MQRLVIHQMSVAGVLAMAHAHLLCKQWRGFVGEAQTWMRLSPEVWGVPQATSMAAFVEAADAFIGKWGGGYQRASESGPVRFHVQCSRRGEDQLRPGSTSVYMTCELLLRAPGRHEKGIAGEWGEMQHAPGMLQ